MSTGLGLPEAVTTCLFDLDGVLTDTARVHRRAWAQMFDAYLRERDGEGSVPFDPERDYEEHVDGLPRADGTRAFLASRGITLPEGEPDDPPTAETVSGLGRRKNALVQDLLEREGVEVFEGSVDYVRAVRAAGLRTAVVSSSASTERVLAVTGLSDLFEVRVDAQRARAEGLAGKPAPDTYLFAGRALGAEPEHAAVFEDALSGVQAGVAGGFAAVVGVARGGQDEALREAGATVVVRDLSELSAP